MKPRHHTARHMIKPLKRSITAALLFVLFTGAAQAQSNVEGINGLDLEKSESSYDRPVNGSFSVFGLGIAPTNLSIFWEPADEEFGVYGSAIIEIDGQSLEVELGTQDNPGLSITEGALSHFNIGITTSIALAGLTLDAQDLRLEYDVDASRYGLGGTVTVTDLWSATLDMGSPGEAGVYVRTDGGTSFDVADVSFEIDHVELGAIDLKQVRLAVVENALEEVDLQVAFPEGWMVEADLLFDSDPFALNGITIDWEADSFDSAIEIGDTGVLLVRIEGGVANLDRPSDLKVIGVVGLAFGGPFELEGEEVSLIQLQDSVSISRTKLEMDGELNLGAYKSGGSWHSLLGRGDVSIVLKWGTEYYMTGSVRVPSNPAMVEADAKVYLDSAGDLDALMDVSFIVPSDIPYVGGTRLGSVDGAFRYRNHHPHASYAAAWTKVNLEFDSFTIGAKYNFGSRSISAINGGDVDDIEQQIQNDEKRDGETVFPLCTVKKSFRIPAGLPPKYYNATLVNHAHDLLDNGPVVTAKGLGTPLPIFRLVHDGHDDIDIPTDFDFKDYRISPSKGQDTLHFLIAPPATISHAQIGTFTIDPRATLTPGKYTVNYTSICDLGIQVPSDAIELQLKPIYPAPGVSMEVHPAAPGESALELDFWSYFPDSTTVSVYWSYERDRKGMLIQHLDYGPNGGERTATVSFVHPVGVSQGTIYVYAVIDDGVSDPRHTPFAEIDLPQAVAGNVTAGPHGLAGASVTIEALGSSGERVVFSHDTDPTGQFEVYNLPSGSYRLDVYTPAGYNFTHSPDGATLYTPTRIQMPFSGGERVNFGFATATTTTSAAAN